jgi:hypothetical protein
MTPRSPDSRFSIADSSIADCRFSIADGLSHV